MRKKAVWMTGLMLFFSMAGHLLPAFATAQLEGSDSYTFGYGRQMDSVDLDAKPIARRQLSLPVASAVAPVALTQMPVVTSDVETMIARFNHQLPPDQVVHMSEAIKTFSQVYNLDPHLLASLIAVESSFRPMAVSRSGAVGLGQLKPDTARWLGVVDPTDPVQNLAGVAKYLRYLMDRYNGSVQHALAAYFQGQGTIDRNGIDAGAMGYISKVNQVFVTSF